MKKTLTLLTILGGLALSSPTLAHEPEESCYEDTEKISDIIIKMDKNGEKSKKIEVAHHFSDKYIDCINRTKDREYKHNSGAGFMKDYRITSMFDSDSRKSYIYITKAKPHFE